MVSLQEFVFQLSHVHVGRAFGLTTLALQAQVQGIVETFANHGVVGKGPGERGPQKVRTTPRRMFLFPGSLEGRAHHASRFPAFTHAVTHLHRSGESFER